MPRTGGVYSPPSGTKGVSNTTIQSVPYNAFVDDLTADANAARPVTAGGTGATTASGARTAIGADNASNLTTGTVADARLPATQAGKTFTSAVSITSGALSVIGAGAGVELGRTDGVASTPFFDFHSGATVVDYDARIIASGGTGVVGGAGLNVIAATFTLGGQTIWHAGNDGAGSGNDAGLFAGQLPAYYTNIVARLGFTPVEQGGGTGQLTNKIYIGWLGTSTLGLQVDSTNYGSTWPMTSSNSLAVGGVGLSNLVQTSRAITAGNGLTGGGNLSADRAFAVGQGTGITVAATTVSVDTTVWRDGNQPTAAQIGSLYAGNAQGTIGTYAFALKKTAGTINPGSTVAGTDLYWSNSANSAVLGLDVGTWRAMGVITNASASVAVRIS